MINNACLCNTITGTCLSCTTQYLDKLSKESKLLKDATIEELEKELKEKRLGAHAERLRAIDDIWNSRRELKREDMYLYLKCLELRYQCGTCPVDHSDAKNYIALNGGTRIPQCKYCGDPNIDIVSGHEEF